MSRQMHGFVICINTWILALQICTVCYRGLCKGHPRYVGKIRGSSEETNHHACLCGPDCVQVCGTCGKTSISPTKPKCEQRTARLRHRPIRKAARCEGEKMIHRVKVSAQKISQKPSARNTAAVAEVYTEGFYTYSHHQSQSHHQSPLPITKLATLCKYPKMCG